MTNPRDMKRCMCIGNNHLKLWYIVSLWQKMTLGALIFNFCLPCVTFLYFKGLKNHLPKKFMKIKVAYYMCVKFC